MDKHGVSGNEMPIPKCQKGCLALITLDICLYSYRHRRVQDNLMNKLHRNVSLQTAPSCYGQSRLGFGRIEIHLIAYYKTGTRVCCVFDGSVNEDLPSHLMPRMLFLNEIKFRIWQCSRQRHFLGSNAIGYFIWKKPNWT